MSVPQRNYGPWVVAVTVTLATFMEVLDTSIANVALPHIAGNLSATQDEATWVLTSYLVSNAIVLPLSAWLSSVFGRKRFYMVCVALFTVSSALCGLAPSLGWLIVFRVLQGAGGGGLQPTEQAILADTFEPAKRGMAFAVYGVAVVTAPALGPVLGGWIADNYTWRWIFYINLPVGLLSLLLTRLVVSADPPRAAVTAPAAARSRRLSIDYVGIALVALALGSLQVVLDKGQQDDWFDSRFIVVFASLAALGLIAAVIWELKQKAPVVELDLLRERSFATAFVLMFALGFVLYGSTVLLPLYLQSLMGYTAMQSGLALTAGALAIMFLMPWVGMMVARIQAKWLIGFGLALGAYGTYRMTHLSLDSSFAQVSFDRVVQASGLAFLFVPINTVAYLFLKPGKNNSASSLLNVARNIGGSVGISLATTILARRAQLHHNVLAAHFGSTNPAFRSSAAAPTGALMPQGAGAGAAHDRATQMLYRLMERQSQMLGFTDAFRIMAITFAVVVPLALLFRRYDPRAAKVAVH